MEDPSNAEVMRRLDDLSAGLKEDLVEIRQALPSYVPRELYEARHGHLMARVAALEESQKQEAEARRNLFRWVVTGLVVPVVLFVIQQWQNAQGGGVT